GSARLRPLVLHRPLDLDAEAMRGLEGPAGVAEQFAAEEDEIGLSRAHDGIRLLRLGDEADGGGVDLRLTADPLGEGDLVARADGDLGIGNEAATRAVDDVDAVLAEEPSELDRLVNVPAAFHPVRRGDADE